MFEHLVEFILIGALSGFIGGLLGIGGGVILIPLLFPLLPLTDDPLHYLTVIATAFAVMSVLTSISMLTHLLQGTVLKSLLPSLGLGIILGALASASMANLLPTPLLQLGFVGYAYVIALGLLRPRAAMAPQPIRHGSFMTNCGFGGFVGMTSSLIGIGGGSFNVPYLLYCGHPARDAIGTSVFLAFPLSLAALAGYFVSFFNSADFVGTQYHFGFIYAPAFIWASLGSVITAIIGARMTLRVPTRRLRQAFGLLLVFIATRFLIDNIL